MGSYVKNVEVYRKLSNETQHGFGKMQPIGKFLNDNARVNVEVIDDQTLRFTYCSIIYYSSKNMLPIVNEVEYKTAKKAIEDICERLAKKLELKVTLRDDIVNDYSEFIHREQDTSQRSAYYRWSALADVEVPGEGKPKAKHLLDDKANKEEDKK